jgi:hypothetical protein
MRLYFHLTNGRDRISDERGVEVTDVEAARRHALEGIAELRQANAIAAALNERQIATARGGRWTARTVLDVLARLSQR